MFLPTNPECAVNIKRKCEVDFVYLVIGIWRNPKTNKQCPTLE